MKAATSNRVALWIGGLILVLACAWAVHWFVENFERSERQVRTQQSLEARRNPFLAAERYLVRLGVEAQSLSGRKWLTQPTGESGVLFVNYPGPSLPPEREEKLLQWVEGGGQLVLVARQLWDDDNETSGNSLLDLVGARLYRVDPEEEDDDEQETKPGDTDLVRIRLEGQGDTAGSPALEVAFRSNRVLDDRDEDASWWLSGDQGYHLLEWRWGEGSITVLSDSDWMSNDALGERDHAWFLSYLVGDQQQVRLLYSSNMPSLLTLLWRNSPYMVISVSACVLLLLWWLARRSGPRLIRSDSVRRNLLEHLQAVSAYAWRTDKASVLLAASQARVETRWRRRHPLLERLEPPARSIWIAGKTGLDARLVQEALYATPTDEQALIRVSAVQQKLMKHLSRNLTRSG